MKDEIHVKSQVSVSHVEPKDADLGLEKSTSTPEYHTVKAWPTQPKPLALSSKERFLWAAFDGILIAMPILLIIKTGLCIYAWHHDKANTGSAIDSASLLSRALIDLNSQLVTAFTIVFVTIISTFVRRFALWKAEQGAYLADLEQLQGSISLPSTLKLVWSLRSFGFKSLLLVLVWSFYYLGSQAVKLEYRLSSSDDFRSTHIAIQRTDAPSYFSSNMSDFYSSLAASGRSRNTKGNMTKQDFARLNTYYQALLTDLFSSNTEDTVDPNPGSHDGPLIPDIDGLSPSASQGSLLDTIRHRFEGWISTSHGRENMFYVSSTGISGIIFLPTYLVTKHPELWTHNMVPRAFLGSYTLPNIPYLNVSCDIPTVLPLPPSLNGTDNQIPSAFVMEPTGSDAQRDSRGHALRRFVYSSQVSTIDAYLSDNGTCGYYDNCTSNMYTPRELQTNCNISTKYVDMEVICLASGCYSSRVRWSNNTSELDATSFSTPFDDDFFASSFLNSFNEQLQDASEYELGLLSHDGLYLSTYGPVSFPTAFDTDQGLASELQSLVSHQLTELFNTYFTLSQKVIFQRWGVNFPPNMTTLLASPGRKDQFYELIGASGAAYNQAYRIYWAWIPVDFVSCLILLAAAIGSCWLRLHTIAPDIFGFVSSLTRDNPHIQLPSQGSTLNGIERARMLKRVKVKLGDVQGNDVEHGSVGTIGLAPVQTGIQPLRSAYAYR